MTTVLKQFNTISSYQSDDFKKYFGDMEYLEKKSKIYTKTLGRNMLDKEILSEYKPTELTLGEVYNYLNSDAKKEDWMIFYCRDEDNILWAVFARWGDGGWDLNAFSVEFQCGWGAGRQVFSRDPFETKSLSDSDPVTLKHLDTSNVKERLQAFIDSLVELKKTL